MSKVIDEGMAQPDDPIFSRGVLISPARARKQSTLTSPAVTGGTVLPFQKRKSQPTGASALSLEDQIWDEVQKQLDEEHREGMNGPSSTGRGPKGSLEERAKRDALVAELFEGFAPVATSTEEAAQQISTREREIIEAHEKMIADNVNLGGRPDDHPLIMKWRKELGPAPPGTKYLTGASLAAVIAAVILAFFGLWRPAGIVAVGAMILFAVPIVWQSLEHRSKEEKGGVEVSKDRERIHHLLAGECISKQEEKERVLKFPPLPEDFEEIELIPYEPPEPDPPTSLTPEAVDLFKQILQAERKEKGGARKEFLRQQKKQGNS